MNTLVVFDSLYGNTEKIARAIGETASEKGDSKTLSVSEVEISKLSSADLIIAGSPTHGGRPSEEMKKFLKKISGGELANKKIAAFDTRSNKEESDLAIRILMKVLGFAGPRIARSLMNKGGIQVVEAEGFVVNDKEGPLKERELERARNWTTNLLENA